MSMAIALDPSEPSSRPGRSWMLNLAPLKSAEGYAAFHAASAEATAESRVAWLRFALEPTGVAGATFAMIGVVVAVGEEVADVVAEVAVEVVVVAGALVVDVAAGADVVAAVVVGDVVVGAGVLVVAVAVGVGELVAVVVGEAVDDAGVPDVQVTELPSAERTQVICDPVLPEGDGAVPGTFEPAPGTPGEGRGDAATELTVARGGGGMLRRAELWPGAVVNLAVPGLTDPPPVDSGPGTDPAATAVVTRLVGTVAATAPLTASTTLSTLTAARSSRELTAAEVDVGRGATGDGELAVAGVVASLAGAAGASAAVGPMERPMASTNADTALVSRGASPRGLRGRGDLASAPSGTGAIWATRPTPMQRPLT